MPDRARIRFLDIWALVGAGVIVVALVYLLKVLAVPVAIAIWTLVFVFCLRGVVNALEARGINRLAGTAVAYVLMFAVLGLIGFLLFSPMFGLNNQLVDLAKDIPTYANGIVAWVNDLASRYSSILENSTVKTLLDEAGKSLTTWASSFAQGGAEGLVVAGSTVVNAGLAIGFGLVIAFWILLELPALGRECMRVIGPKHAEAARFIHLAFTRIMGGYIKGTLVQCAIIGVAGGILFAVAGIPNAAALGAITGVLNIIPIVGPWLGGAAAAIVALFVSPWAALAAVVGTVVITHVVYTFISPKIMQSSVDVHPALTLFALMCGSALGGAMAGLMGSLVGMLASIPAAAVAKSLFVYYFEKKTGRKVSAEDGVFLK